MFVCGIEGIRSNKYFLFLLLLGKTSTPLTPYFYSYSPALLNIVFAYSKMRRMIALNVEMISSFCLPDLLEVSVLRMLSIGFALVMVTFNVL